MSVASVSVSANTCGPIESVKRTAQTPLALSLIADVAVAAFMMAATTFVVPAATWKLALAQFQSWLPWMSVAAPAAKEIVASRHVVDTGTYVTVAFLIAYPLYRQIARTLRYACKDMGNSGLFSWGANRKLAALGACGSVACMMMLAGALLVGHGLAAGSTVADVAGRVLMTFAVMVVPCSVALCAIKWFILDVLGWGGWLFGTAQMRLEKVNERPCKLYLLEIAVCTASFVLLLVACAAALISLGILAFGLVIEGVQLAVKLIRGALTLAAALVSLWILVKFVLPLTVCGLVLFFGLIFG